MTRIKVVYTDDGRDIATIGELLKEDDTYLYVKRPDGKIRRISHRRIVSIDEDSAGGVNGLEG